MAVDINDLLSRYDTEIARLTRRALLAETEVAVLRAKIKDNQPEISEDPLAGS